jgi:hypothetical protein
MGGRDSPNRGTPWIADGILHIVEDSVEATLHVDSDAWFSWLAEAARFYVKHPIGNFFCRKELRKRGGPYWSAYRRYRGRVYRAHVGRDEDVTSARLDAIAARLAQQIDEREVPVSQQPTQKVKAMRSNQSQMQMIVAQAEANAHEISRLRAALSDTLAVVEHLTRTAEGVLVLAGQALNDAIEDDARRGVAEGQRVLRLYGDQKHTIKGVFAEPPIE